MVATSRNDSSCRSGSGPALTLDHPDRTNYWEVVPSNFFSLRSGSNRRMGPPGSFDGRKLANHAMSLKREERTTTINLMISRPKIAETMYRKSSVSLRPSLLDDLTAASPKTFRFLPPFYTPKRPPCDCSDSIRRSAHVRQHFRPVKRGPEFKVSPRVPCLERERVTGDRVSLPRIYWQGIRSRSFLERFAADQLPSCLRAQ